MKRQISLVKAFQIIYVDIFTFMEVEHNTPLLMCGAEPSDFFPKSTVWKKQ